MNPSAILVLIAAAVSVGATALAVLSSDGWGVLLWLPLCFVTGLMHLILQGRLVRNTEMSASVVRVALLSSALFVVGFLLQVDEGDGPRWIIATALVSPEGGGGIRLPAWWPFWINWLAFLPMVASFIIVARRTGR